MFLLNFCPPPGPWPMPPWCSIDDVETNYATKPFKFLKPEEKEAFFQKPMFFLCPSMPIHSPEVLDKLQPHAFSWTPMVFDNVLAKKGLDWQTNFLHLRSIHLIGAGLTPSHLVALFPENDIRPELANIDVHGNLACL